MKGKWFPIIAGIVLLAVVAGGFVLLQRARSSPAAKQNQPPAPTSTESEIILTGRIQAVEIEKVPVPVDGRIAAFHVEVGGEVYEGQLLAEIQSEGLDSQRQLAAMELERAQSRVNNLEASLSAARLEASRASADAARLRAELDRASKDYTRQKLLFAEGATPRLTYEKAEKEFKGLETESATAQEVAKQSEERVSTLQSEIDRQRKVLEDKSSESEVAEKRATSGQVLSPVNGVVTGRRGAVGEEVHPAMNDLFQIAFNLSTLQVLLEPHPAQFGRIKPGQTVAVSLADLPNEALPGTVKGVEGDRVIVEFANPSPLVKPGMTATVRIKSLPIPSR